MIGLFVCFFSQKRKKSRASTAMKILTHRFTQEPRTTFALLALYSRWLPNPSDLISELSTQHARFVVEESKSAAPNWASAARFHVLFVMQQFLECSPELFGVDTVWQLIRKTTRAWQKNCATDGGEAERKLRKWMKVICLLVSLSFCADHKQQVSQRRFASSGNELNQAMEELKSLKASGQMIEFSKLVSEVDPKVVAEQMCLLDAVFFRSIPKSELLLCDELSSPNVETAAPNW
jgi:hypothetical protein